MVKKKQRSTHGRPGASTTRTYTPKTFAAACSACGKHTIMPFKPEPGQTCLCVDCFQNSKKK